MGEVARVKIRRRIDAVWTDFSTADIDFHEINIYIFYIHTRALTLTRRRAVSKRRLWGIKLCVLF